MSKSKQDWRKGEIQLEQIIKIGYTINIQISHKDVMKFTDQIFTSFIDDSIPSLAKAIVRSLRYTFIASLLQTIVELEFSDYFETRKIINIDMRGAA